MFLPDEGKLCETIIAEKTYLRRNNIPENIYSILSSLHIGGENTRSTNAKQKLPQILPFTKRLKELSLIKYWRVLMMNEQFTYS